MLPEISDKQEPMDFIDAAHLAIDGSLISLFRFTDDPVAGFYIGVFCLCLAAVVTGEVSFLGAYRLNRKHYEDMRRDMTRMHNLSLKAISVKDKDSYKAANRLANESYGKTFFSQAALFCASLWPVPFLLGWMSLRFNGVEIPFFFTDISFVAAFLGMYILVRFAFSRVKTHIPPFSRVYAVMRERELGEERALTWDDFVDKDQEMTEDQAENRAEGQFDEKAEVKIGNTP